MELDPRRSIENFVGPTVRNVQRLGNELIGVFARPGDAEALVRERITEQQIEDEILYHLECKLDHIDPEFEDKLTQRAFSWALGSLSVSEEERSEDDNLRLKRIKAIYEERPRIAISLRIFSHDDRIKLLSHLVPEAIKVTDHRIGNQ